MVRDGLRRVAMGPQPVCNLRSRVEVAVVLVADEAERARADEPLPQNQSYLSFDRDQRLGRLWGHVNIDRSAACGLWDAVAASGFCGLGV